MGDHRTDLAVSAGDSFRELSSVIGQLHGGAIHFPHEDVIPIWAGLFGLFPELTDILVDVLGFCQGQCRKLVLLLDEPIVIGNIRSDLLCRRIRIRPSAQDLQLQQPVVEIIVFLIGHELTAGVVVGIGCFPQLCNQLVHLGTRALRSIGQLKPLAVAQYVSILVTAGE